MIASAFVFTGCSKETLKLGLGVCNYYETVTNADGELNGKATVVSTAAAVLLDKDNRIVKCEIDCSSNTVEFTSDGKFVKASDFKTKYELGYDYNMKKYGSEKEWFEQVDAFESLVKGKTIDEVKALVSTAGKGNTDVVSAGCTIAIEDFAKAIEKAVNNAVESQATEADTLKIAIATEQTGSDATADKTGYNQIEMSFVACVTESATGTVVAITNDSVQTKIAFDTTGTTTTDKANAISTKKELGDSYGMKSPYGSEKEWYEHSAAFDATCLGKTAAEIATLEKADGYGVEALQSAGCTIAVSGMVKAAVKAATK